MEQPRTGRLASIPECVNRRSNCHAGHFDLADTALLTLLSKPRPAADNDIVIRQTTERA